MCALLGLVLCVSLMFWTSGNAYARGGTYHHAEFVPFNSKTTRPPPQVTERHQCRGSAGSQSCTRCFTHYLPDASLARPTCVWR